MSNLHNSILASINKPKDEPYKILTSAVHEGYQSNFAGFNALFYLANYPGCNTWNSSFRKMPDNFIKLTGQGFQQLPLGHYMDIAWSQNKFGMFQFLAPLAERLGIPLVSMEHTLPVPGREYVAKSFNAMKGHINIFITEFQIKQWGWERDQNTYIIPCCTDTDFFHPLDDTSWHGDGKILTVQNDYINRDIFLNFKLYQQLTYNLPTNPVGKTEGLGQPAKDTADLRSKYQNASVFLNTTSWSTMPNTLLEAMACGCPIVTTATCSITDWCIDGYNAIVSNDPKVLRNGLEHLLNHPNEARELGRNARKTAIEKFGLSDHLNQWKTVFDRAFGHKYA